MTPERCNAYLHTSGAFQAAEPFGGMCAELIVRRSMGHYATGGCFWSRVTKKKISSPYSELTLTHRVNLNLLTNARFAETMRMYWIVLISFKAHHVVVIHTTIAIVVGFDAELDIGM